MIEFPVSPIAFQIGSITVRWYGIFLALAVLWLIAWMWWQIRKGAKLSVDTMLTLALVGIPSGVIFARLIHVIDNIVVARLHPELVLSGQVIDYTQNWVKVIGGEGLTAWGAVLGASLGIWIYCKIAKIKIGYVFDMLAPGIIMAQAIGRIGCLFNGCCYGVETDVPWSVKYTDFDSLAYGAGATHPTVIYEIIYNVIIFGVLFKLRRKLKPDGALYVFYLALYSAWRVAIDFIREGTPFLFGLHQAQVIGIIILIITIPWMVKKMRTAKAETPSVTVPGPSDQAPPSA